MFAPLRILAAAILIACAAALPVEAQAPGAAPQGTAPHGVPVPRPRPAPVAVPRVDTDALKSDVVRNEAFQQRLGAELEAARGDRGKLNQLLVDTGARSREVEQQLIEVEARMTELDRTGAQIQASLVQRRAVLAEVLAALVRMGRNPPPALLMRPDDALDAVRSAILLGAILPEMRVEAETLAADLSELARVRTELSTARERLTGLRHALEEDRARIAALVGERQRRQAEANPAQATDKAQAETVAKGTGDVHDLVTRLETEVPQAARAAEAARAGPAAAPGGGAPSQTEIAALQNPTRIAPAMPFSEAKGLLPLPVAGVRLKDFGAVDGVGGAEKGLTIATRMGAQVTAPTDGWVVYAGPFRSYGQLLIINAGGGYHVLMAGMERITVDLGQFVLAGEPVAVMGSGPRTAGAASGQPQLYVEFRKDGVSIDPAPWWAATDSQKVRG
ncbi:murein hydrolase activator EnvC family protein [Aquabacter cavernae]|uniref:murein hydrolase activator EnvC family protein n=1 Tax=Aquabacter cavernae TaxID=2496029 RepID=UPI000F8C5185|nr:peptidoglycan DD-metalloendopeptidase family protein [Aquabacter cavernae]